MHRLVPAARLLVPALSLALVAAAAGTAVAAPSATPSTAAPQGSTPPAGQDVLLVDGTVVHTTSAGAVLFPSGQHAAVVLGAGTHSPKVVPRIGGALAATLDQELFDVAALGTAENSSAGRLPLTISYAGARPSLPGVVWTGATSGYVTRASAPAFGAALRTGSSASGVTRIALAGAVAGASPQYVMHTLRLRADVAGLSTTYGSVVVQDVDDVARWQSISLTYPGVDSRLSVPDGHYVVYATYEDLTGKDPTTRVLTVPLTVQGDTTLTLDPHTATAPVGVDTPLPAVLHTTVLTLALLDAVGGQQVIADVDSYHPGDFLVAPTPAGVRSRLLESFHLEPAVTGPAPYTCDLALASAGFSGDESHHVRPADLAAVRGRFSAYGTTTQASYVDLPLQTLPHSGQVIGLTGQEEPVPLPSTRTQYTTVGYWQPVLAPGSAVGGDLAGAPQLYQAGTSPAQEWLRAPLHPGAALAPAPGSGILDPSVLPSCLMCREGDRLRPGISPVTGDGHAGDAVGSTRWTLTADGRPVASGTTPLSGGSSIPVPHATATYRLTYDVSRPGAPSAATTSTTWTFPSGPSTGMPTQDVVCVDGATQLAGCRVQRLLTVDYRLPVDLAGREAAGATTATVLVSAAPGAAVLAPGPFSAQVSDDGGRTWRPAVLAASGGGRFQLAYTNPSAGTSVSLRIHAQDAQGSAIDQTVLDAYTTR